MSLQKLTLIGLRGFSTEQELSFAIPNGKTGSGLTMLVGPNNGGKSTVIEALRTFSGPSPPSFTEGRRNKHAEDKVSIQMTDISGDVSILRTVASGGSETEWFTGGANKNIFVLPSRRHFNPFFSKSTVTRENYMVA